MAGPEEKKADAAGGEQPAIPAIPASVRVVSDIPVVFADGVSSQSYGIGISKFFLVRIDPDPQSGPNRPVLIQQVVMPIDGFIQMWAFFEHRLKIMIKDGVATKDMVERFRADIGKLPGGSDEPL
jgi:hypothetical protein